MLVYLQIAFTILSALFIAAIIPVGALLNWAYALACGFIALLFFGLMLLCKQSIAMKAPPTSETPTSEAQLSDEKSSNETEKAEK